MFSSRLPPRLEPNAVARAVEGARASGRRLNDLTVSNPTQVGLTHPAGLYQALSTPDVASYLPDPRGLRSAREAVSEDYGRRGLAIPWDRIVLTSSTSEAYSLLFKLLCAPCGDDVLVPVPSYPLFEHLTALDGVAVHAYRLEYDGRWWLDMNSVDESWDARTRAVLAVSPNNPTGSLLTADEAAALSARCADRGAALIVDEVFADYPLHPHRPATVVHAGGALTFRLGGLSKSVALPQMKLGWIAVDGPEPLVAEALERLDLIADTYLSVSTPVQVAAESLLRGGAARRTQVLERVRSNYAQLTETARSYPSVDVLDAEAGWSAVVRIPSGVPEEQFVLDLLEEEGVLVHPGYFFDFPREAYLIVSLLPEPDRFRAGIHSVFERADA